MTPKCRHLLCTDNDKPIHLHSITRRSLGVKETVKDYVPVDSESVTHNMCVLLMFRSVMVHIKGTYVFLACF